MHKVRMVSIASLSMGSLSSAGNSVLAVWVMVHLPRYAASSGPQGQLPSTERYRYPQSAERLPSGPVAGLAEGSWYRSSRYGVAMTRVTPATTTPHRVNSEKEMGVTLRLATPRDDQAGADRRGPQARQADSPPRGGWGRRLSSQGFN